MRDKVLETVGYFSSPYSASKAAADLLALAYHKTYGLPVIVTRCSNNYGPYQFPEKLVPLMITNALEDKPLPVYGDGLNVRDWLHVQEHCLALDLIMHQGKPGQVYNIGGRNEWKNIDIVRRILNILDKHGKSKLAGLNQVEVKPISITESNRPAPRPIYSVLDNYCIRFRRVT